MPTSSLDQPQPSIVFFEANSPSTTTSADCSSLLRTSTCCVNSFWRRQGTAERSGKVSKRGCWFQAPAWQYPQEANILSKDLRLSPPDLKSDSTASDTLKFPWTLGRNKRLILPRMAESLRLSPWVGFGNLASSKAGIFGFGVSSSSSSSCWVSLSSFSS